jgi:hypothetical protein
MIVQFPKTKTTPELALALVAQEITPSDSVFIITVREDGEVWIRTSNYHGRDLHVAAAHLMVYSINHVAKTQVD